MELYEIICGAIVLLLSLLIVIVCQMQDQNSQQNMTSAITGASSDSFYGRNEGRTREAILARFTRTLGIIIFLTILVMNIVIPIILNLTSTAE